MQPVKFDSPMDAAWWDQAYRERNAEQWTIWRDRRLLELVRKEIPDYSSVLLLACGAAAAAQMLDHANLQLRWSYCDYSAAALDLARAQAPAGVEYVQADLDEAPWPFEDKTYDIVICSELLEHLINPKDALQEATRIARHLVVATFPIHESLITSLHRWLFEPADVWRLMQPDHTLRVHHLRESKLLLALGKPL